MADFAMLEDDELYAISRSKKKIFLQVIDQEVESESDLEFENEEQKQKQKQNINYDVVTNDNVYEFYNAYKTNEEKMNKYNEFIENIAIVDCIVILNSNTEQFSDHQVTNDLYKELMANISMRDIIATSINFPVLIQLLTRQEYDCQSINNLEETLLETSVQWLEDHIEEFTLQQYKLIRTHINFGLIHSTSHNIKRFIGVCKFYETNKTELAPMFVDILMNKVSTFGLHNNVQQRNLKYAKQQLQQKLMSIEQQKNLVVNDIVDLYNNVNVGFGSSHVKNKWFAVKVLEISDNSVIVSINNNVLQHNIHPYTTTLSVSNIIESMNNVTVYFTDMRIAKRGTFTNGKIHSRKINCMCTLCEQDNMNNKYMAMESAMNMVSVSVSVNDITAMPSMHVTGNAGNAGNAGNVENIGSIGSMGHMGGYPAGGYPAGGYPAGGYSYGGCHFPTKDENNYFHTEDENHFDQYDIFNSKYITTKSKSETNMEPKTHMVQQIVMIQNPDGTVEQKVIDVPVTVMVDKYNDDIQFMSSNSYKSNNFNNWHNSKMTPYDSIPSKYAKNKETQNKHKTKNSKSKTIYVKEQVQMFDDEQNKVVIKDVDVPMEVDASDTESEKGSEKCSVCSLVNSPSIISAKKVIESVD